MSGKLRGHRAWGRLSRSGLSAFGTRCLAAGVRWHAHLVNSPAVVPSKTYIGATSQGMPVFLSASSKTVVSFDFGWTADCADGQTHTNTISAGGGPIASGAFSLGGVLNTGGHFQVDGNVNGAIASGTLSRSGSNAFGAFDCSATGVTWQARVVG